jgi:uracil-DNA glycosylase family 4
MLGSDLAGLTGCRRCGRLLDYIAALPPRRGLCRGDYWNGPVPGFGDPQARVALIGLAPGAHGANRTGRPFTGDGAGDFMYPLLHRAGFASRAEALAADDGLRLRDLYISNAVKCVPPDNKPAPAEFACCRPFLAEELASLPRLRVVVALGQGAFTSYLRQLQGEGRLGRLADYPFAHGAVYRLAAGTCLVASYHTSRYNIQTRRLTEAMFLELLAKVKRLAGGENG